MEDIWTELESHIDFVLTHPNGWHAAEQSHILRAAVIAGLVPADSQKHIQLMTEDEARLHFCISSSLTANVKMVSGS